MSWSAMVSEEEPVKRILEDHHGTYVRMLRLAHESMKAWADSVMYDRGFSRGWGEAVAWYRRQLLEWESLTVDEAIRELGKGEGSLWWPIFGEDPVFWVDCPGGHKCLVDARGLCDSCGFDFLAKGSEI
ncbi:hypothetical protein [Microbacterium terrisoli]|uniref:hypothetical protein n=1 Tax=Microbacterium terrisoli TaxID=3242192 RepID=UPI0028054E92|nr:hypothetical protein [Microbacterium protaetiae]